MPSFREYLRTYHKGQDTPIGDLYKDATDLRRARFSTDYEEIWEGETPETLKEFMQKHNACHEAYQVLEEAEEEYKKHL
ncbi:hypothetical protein NIES4071_105170 (plasmid) [Calothrix sp. NIES-4071]|nr:hypothetical protein NIES4071_105170 [Calothrix sp. NIES-4071]BAZ64935.1 hypothetical protein NIES4105_106680 [Calothrix sp. NIES-4105]